MRRVQGLSRTLVHPRGGWLTAAGLAALSIVLSLGALVSERLGDHPLILLTLPLALAAVIFGVRGGIALASLESAIATVWWIAKGSPGGVSWIAARVLAYVVVGFVVGKVADTRADLNRRLKHHHELSLDLIATANFDGYFTQLNPAFPRTLGFTIEELTSRPLLEFVHPDDREPTLDAIAAQAEEGREILQFQNRT